ncbi:MAG TPA: alpha-galactosidase [Candidatus Hydrogenedentes bacterium]|nr:alpha-galactosidase [Candidatus Hydrogenedentota bacterium]
MLKTFLCLMLVISIALPAVALVSPLESDIVDGWLNGAGVSGSVEIENEPEAGLEVVSARQDYREPTPDVSCHTRTPLRIGGETFEKGIGAHANGEIILSLAGGFSRFVAQVGIDNNEDTKGERGSARFLVRVDDEVRFESPVCRGGDAPVLVEVPLNGAKRLELIVRDAGDGYTYDQADWAIGALERKDGERVYISDALVRSRETPFRDVVTSFSYDGQECWTLFETWERKDEPVRENDGKRLYEKSWTEPGSGFTATLAVARFVEPEAIELQWRFANRGTAPSGLLTDVKSLEIRASGKENAATLVSSSGGTTGNLQSAPGFEIVRTGLGERTLTVADGRSSNGDLPFFMLSSLQDSWGVACALGWSGSWCARAGYDKAASMVRLDAGMTPLRFRLPAGESLSLPAALLIPFRGDESEGSNRMRRALREHYQGRLGGRLVDPPVSFSSWFVFDNNVHAAMLKELANEAAGLGIEYFCLDAGWFEGDFPYGVGNWTVNQEKFPEGLRPVSDHVHALGMKFGLWFEPERVAAGTRWARECPQLLCGNVSPEAASNASRDRPYLLDLAKPEARRLVLEMMDPIIREAGVDWIRYDFNISPGPVWEAIEGPEEQGLRQALYINGLYALLDELMSRHPNLLIEQCASGGRRIDLETVRRGHTFWKSDDTLDQPLMRFHQTGGNYFLLGGHLNTNYCELRSGDEMLALFGGLLGFGLDFRVLDDAQKATIRRTVAAYKEVRGFLNRDYYPLFPQARAGNDWTGWEFVDPQSQGGYFAVFRPEHSPYGLADVRLKGLRVETRFRMWDVMSGQEREAGGAELSQEIGIALAPGKAQVWQFSAK